MQFRRAEGALRSGQLSHYGPSTGGEPDVVIPELQLHLSFHTRLDHQPRLVIMILNIIITILIQGLSGSPSSSPRSVSEKGAESARNRHRTSWRSLDVALLSLLVVMVVATGCTTSGSDDRLRVVVTTSIWADVVSSIAGDDAEVETLIPVGADAHDYQPSAQQVADIEEAGLVVINGLGLEEGLLAILGNLEDANILSLAEGLNPIPLASTHDQYDEEAEHDQDEGGLDPHVWFDPLRVAEAARIIAGELAAIDDSVDWMARATAFAADLEAVDETIATILDAIAAEGRKMVTNHDSLGYFADRYEFEVVGVVIPGGSTQAEPSSADLADLVEAIETEGVAAIFTETSHTDALAVAVAAEVGRDIAVVELFTESLGEPGSGAETVAGMLETNARRITEALS